MFIDSHRNKENIKKGNVLQVFLFDKASKGKSQIFLCNIKDLKNSKIHVNNGYFLELLKSFKIEIKGLPKMYEMLWISITIGK